ncbi:TPA: hypothetical protein ACH3X2_006522 [Trebouxia sp. C0005]
MLTFGLAELHEGIACRVYVAAAHGALQLYKHFCKVMMVVSEWTSWLAAFYSALASGVGLASEACRRLRLQLVRRTVAFEIQGLCGLEITSADSVSLCRGVEGTFKGSKMASPICGCTWPASPARTAGMLPCLFHCEGELAVSKDGM